MQRATGVRILAGLSLVFAAATGTAADADNEALKKAVACAEIAFALSVENGDSAVFAASVHPDARFVGNGVSRGRAEVVEAWAPFFAPDGPRLTWRPMIVEVLESGDLALSRGPYRLEATAEDGSPIEQWGTFNSTWQRQADGRWQVIFDAGSPAAGELPDEVRKLILEPAGACAK
ncbi:MAG TPA: nuclear transport factor 2 family protein [Woeseiaceae bacterium]|nr:nuclear transport factor 2 family protein [Woeseiaceae bacterium]